MSQGVNRFSGFSLFAISTACLSGFLFGYFMAIISGALTFISSAFTLSLGKESIFVSILLLGAVLGSVLGGYFTDKLGRKKVFFLTGLCLIVGSLFLISTSSYSGLIIARILQGVSIGSFSVLAPLYLAEVASVVHRGKIVAAYQLTMNLGIFSAYIVNGFYFSEGNWQMMFVVGLIPALLQLILLFFIPESPLWLFKKKQKTLSLEMSKKLQLPPIAEEEDHKKNKLGAKTFIYIFWIGILLSISQQFTGINIVVYYAPRIFYEAGYQTPLSAMIATTCLGATFFLSCLLSVWLVDKFGRKKLLLFGVMGMMMSLFCFSLFSFFQFPFLNHSSVILLIAYVVFFSIGIGPVTWVLLSEIYPMDIRDKAMSMALVANWLSVFFILWSFPHILSWIKISGVFGVYGVMNLFIFFFILKYIPETKQKSFEQIFKLFERQLKGLK